MIKTLNFNNPNAKWVVVEQERPVGNMTFPANSLHSFLYDTPGGAQEAADAANAMFPPTFAIG